MVQAFEHPEGAFCYLEAGSIDVKLTHRFYEGLFEWGVDENPFPDGGSYTRFLVRDLPVAGVFSVDADQDLSRLPAKWWPFVSVESVRDVLERAVALGAVPFGDVVEVSDMFSAAEFVDPAGAICGLWQAGTHIGANVVNEPGALSWTDLVTPDPSTAASFYGELFGWTVEVGDSQPGSYDFFTIDGTARAGLARCGSGGTASWRAHVGVTDLDAATTAAVRLGGVVGPEVRHISGLGRRAEITDPNGISLLLIEAKP